MTVDPSTASAAVLKQLVPIPVPLARLRPGARLLTDRKGANDTYYGIVYSAEFEGQAYVKDLDETQLANELLAAVLGLTSGLPMPRPFLVAITADALATAKGPTLTDGSARLAFGSASAPFEQIGRVDQLIALDAIRHWPCLADAACFDEWI